MVEGLITLIGSGDDVTLAKMRPYALADQGGFERRRILELFLLGTRKGLPEFQWHLLCPICRGRKSRVSRLSEIESDVHCDVCNISFGVNCDRQVELTFRPNAAIRAVLDQDFHRLNLMTPREDSSG